jgi:signal transduction histidine kinase
LDIRTAARDNPKVPPSGTRRRILLCEDDPDLREELADTLETVGHHVVTSMDGWDALHQMRVNRPDLVVLDLLMPVMSGWQFRAEQKRDPALADIPVVVISGSESAAAVAVDADLYIKKPLNAETLLRAIDDVLETRERMMNPTRAAQSERMAALGTLAAGIAHEINNPLTYVLLQLETASRRLRARAAADPAPRKDLDGIVSLVDSALEGAGRIRDVAAGVRAFARGDEQSRALLDVRTVMDGSIKLVANELRHRATLVRDYQEVPPVLANESRLGQVFLNLITNAMQAIPEGAASANEIRITTHTDEGGDAVIEVADTGAGIPDHVIGHIFEPFFTTKSVGHGTGLGLSITHGIVRAYGGEITVSGAAGATSFRVRLPAAPRHAQRAATEEMPVDEAPYQRRRILVVDDEAAVCRALREALVGEHDVVACSSGLHALSILAADAAFDLILCDLHVPEMTGMGLYERLVRVRPELAVRVVFMTAGAFTDLGRTYQSQPPRPLVEKPLDLARLRALLARGPSGSIS